MASSKPLFLHLLSGSPPPAPSPERRQHLQRVVGIGYLLDALMLAGYALAGHIVPGVWGLFCLSAGVLWLGSGVLARAAARLRYREPLLLAWQLGGCGLIQIAALTIAPGLWVIFVLSLLHVTLLGAQSIRRTHLTWIAGLASTTAATAIMASPGAPAFPTDGTYERALLTLLLAITFARFAWAAGHMGGGRADLRMGGGETPPYSPGVEEEAMGRGVQHVVDRALALELLSAEGGRFERGGPAFSVALIGVAASEGASPRPAAAAPGLAMDAVQRLLLENKRKQDVVARFGEAELMVILPQCSGQNALAVSERLRTMLTRRAPDWPAPGLRVDVSVAVASSRPGESVEDLLTRADLVLYAARNEGRDRAVSA